MIKFHADYCSVVEAATSISISGHEHQEVKKAADAFLIAEFGSWANGAYGDGYEEPEAETEEDDDDELEERADRAS